MSETVVVPVKPVRKARRYLRLLLMIPGLIMLGVGLNAYMNVEDGGDVTGIKLTTKPGMVGQAAEVVANIKSPPDLYVKVVASNQTMDMPVRKNTPVGNGLTWDLPRPIALHDLQRVDVFDHNRVFSDDQLDRVTLGAWSTDGQLFHVDLLGVPNAAPRWAVPVSAIGGVITLWALLRFVWDQVI